VPHELRARAAAAGTAPRPRAVQLIPSGRSVALSLALAALALLAYVGARETHVFAVRSIEVEGVHGGVARRVEAALVPLEGTSLLKVKGDDVTRLATALPYVAGVTYDRAFPNTLRVRVETEQPLAVVRHGIQAWLVSRRGRATEQIAQGTHRTLPRIWLPKTVDVALGATLGTGAGAEEVAILAPLHEARLARRVASVHETDGQWVYMLRGGLELRVGAPSDLPLKLAIARRILDHTPVSGYLDVSVPTRPVAGLDTQVSG
jgi:hypothetical protein